MRTAVFTKKNLVWIGLAVEVGLVVGKYRATEKTAPSSTQSSANQREYSVIRVIISGLQCYDRVEKSIPREYEL